MSDADWEYTPELIFKMWQAAQWRVVPGEGDTIEELTKELNSHLRAERAKCPVVYGVKGEAEWNIKRARSGEFYSDTHTARLDGIRELGKP